jgi:glutamine synthetase
LPDPVDVDPAALSAEILEARGIARLPSNLRDALDLFVEDDALVTAFGRPLVESIVAVRESELELFADATPEDVAAATRWVH